MASFLLHDSQSKCYSTTSSLHAGMVDQDLDAALDDLLEGTFDMTDDTDNDKTVDDFISAVDVDSVKDVSFVNLFYDFCGRENRKKHPW